MYENKENMQLFMLTIAFVVLFCIFAGMRNGKIDMSNKSHFIDTSSTHVDGDDIRMEARK